MSAWEWARTLGILGPIAAMLIVGFVLSVRSGVATIGSSAGWAKAYENTSHAVLVLAGCLVGMAVLHQMVGLRVALAW